jgi:hypothetical protein
VRGSAPHPQSPLGADKSLFGANSIGSPRRRDWRRVLPRLLHVLALLLMALPILPDAGQPTLAHSVAALAVYEAGDDPAPADIPKMARAAYDADDLREAFAVHGPRLLAVAEPTAAFDPMPADEPDTREDHPPIRPPRPLV